MPQLTLTDAELAMVAGAGPEEIIEQVRYWLSGGHRDSKTVTRA